jgi:hypothetical protein
MTRQFNNILQDQPCPSTQSHYLAGEEVPPNTDESLHMEEMIQYVISLAYR